LLEFLFPSPLLFSRSLPYQAGYVWRLWASFQTFPRYCPFFSLPLGVSFVKKETFVGSFSFFSLFRNLRSSICLPLDFLPPLTLLERLYYIFWFFWVVGYPSGPSSFFFSNLHPFLPHSVFLLLFVVEIRWLLVPLLFVFVCPFDFPPPFLYLLNSPPMTWIPSFPSWELPCGTSSRHVTPLFTSVRVISVGPPNFLSFSFSEFSFWHFLSSFPFFRAKGAPMHPQPFPPCLQDTPG